MKRAVLYLRVSTLDQTTANQERELREIAARIEAHLYGGAFRLGPKSPPKQKGLIVKRAESIERMEEAIMSLPELYRDVFVLTKVESLSYREAAEILRIPLGTLQSRLWKAVRILQAELTEFHPSPTESAIAECPA